MCTTFIVIAIQYIFYTTALLPHNHSYLWQRTRRTEKVKMVKEKKEMGRAKKKEKRRNEWKNGNNRRMSFHCIFYLKISTTRLQQPVPSSLKSHVASVVHTLIQHEKNVYVLCYVVRIMIISFCMWVCSEMNLHP